MLINVKILADTTILADLKADTTTFGAATILGEA
jgi:hypothetical protein